MRKKILIAKYLFLVAVILVFIFPIYFMFVTSLSTKAEIEIGALIPHKLYLKNWSSILRGYWGLAIRNSLIISVLCIVFTLVVSFPAAYVFSRHKFMADKHLFFWLLTNRMAPPVVFVIGFLIMFRAYGLWDTIPGVVLAYSLFNIPIAIWLLDSFMKDIPKELDNAAFLDGYSLWGYFRRIFIPLNAPGIATTSFFVWIFSWTEMFIASVITSVGAKPITVQLLITMGRVGYGVEYGLAASAGVITIIPGLVLVYWAKKYIAKGFTLGRM